MAGYFVAPPAARPGSSSAAASAGSTAPGSPASPAPARTAPGSTSSDREYFKQVMATDKPYISDGLTTRVSNRRVVVIAVPTRDAAGRLTGLLAGALDFAPSPASKRAIDLGLADLVILDRTGQQLSNPKFAPAEEHGAVRVDQGRRRREVRRDGARGRQGPRRRLGATRSCRAGRSRSTGRGASVFASARHALILELVSIAVAALVVLGLLAWAILRSRREVESEREHMRRWDELSQSLGEASAPAEVTGALISALATAFPRACLIVALEAEDQPGPHDRGRPPGRGRAGGPPRRPDRARARTAALRQGRHGGGTRPRRRSRRRAAAWTTRSRRRSARCTRCRC